MRAAPPATEDELTRRARDLEGTRIADLARRLAFRLAGESVRTKGKVGELLERALGASGGPGATWDFPDLRVELKTVPVDERGRIRETTFVCAVSLMDADRATWESSWARGKLARVLWVPVRDEPGGGRTIGRAVLWSPTAAQDRALADDFDEIMGQIGIGGIEGVSARLGRYMQLRPKAATGSVRTAAPGPDGEIVATVPRGFYLRTAFTTALLEDPAFVP